jgi:hypothetical protein
MELNPIQFSEIKTPNKFKIRQLPKYSQKIYPQLTEQLAIQIREARLAKLLQRNEK